MMGYSDSYYGSSYHQQPDPSQFVPNPLYDGDQGFYQPYGDGIRNSQEVWQASQDISLSLKSALLSFKQRTKVYMHESQATFMNHEASIRNLEEKIGEISLHISKRPYGISTNDMIVSPIEQCHSLTTNGMMINPQLKASEMTSLTVKEILVHKKNLIWRVF
jgi:hypothetical protein